MKVSIISFIIAGITLYLSLALFGFGFDYKVILPIVVVGMISATFGAAWSHILLNKEYGKLYKARRELHKEVRNLADTMSELNKVRGELKGSVAKLD